MRENLRGAQSNGLCWTCLAYANDLTCDTGLSMVRKRLSLNGCRSGLTWEEAVYLTALGGKVRLVDLDSVPSDKPAVTVGRILCWWCREYHSPAEVVSCMAIPRKVASAESSTSSTSSALVAGPLSQYSELWAFLTAAAYEDGQKRRTGRLSLSCEQGMLGILLNDEETGQYAFLNGRSLEGLLTEVELRLGDGSLSWRPSRFQSRAKR